MHKTTTLLLTVALASSSLLTSCESSAGTGALIGAAAGGAIGHNTGSGDRTRTLVGAGLGALAGALAGQAYDEHKREKYGNGHANDDRYETQGRRYPYGELTRYDGYVRSPYRPYNLIDVRGIPSGALVIDPSVDRPFRNP